MTENNTLVLSSLKHTWIIDIDGTIVKHNGYKIDGENTLLDGAKDFLDSIPEGDFVLFVTSRTDEYKKMTIDFLAKHHIRYDQIIFNVPYGERILLNDDKPSGLEMGVAFNKKRDSSAFPYVVIDKEK